MSSKEDFINYIKNGGDHTLVSLQIGAGAGFDTKLAGKEWISETTIQDTLDAYEKVKCSPFLNIALPDFGLYLDQLAWKTSIKEKNDIKIVDQYLSTPFGDLAKTAIEKKRAGITLIKYPLTADNVKVFDILQWFVEQYYKCLKFIPNLVEPVVEKYSLNVPLCIQWNLQPFELLGLLSVDQLVILAMTNKDNFAEVCDSIRDINIQIAESVIKCGADFVFLGAPGSEMLSPSIYEEFIVPDSKIISDAVHKSGGLIYSHICSPVEPFLTNGYYNEIGIDLFETLSEPPVGNISSLKYARDVLNKNICTRGNLGLDILLNGTQDDVVKATQNIIESTKSTKHIVAASDYLFYDIPLENVKAMAGTVKSLNLSI